MTPNRFKTMLSQDPARRSIGSWLMSASAAVAEAMGHCGFDFLVIDMEHSPLDLDGTLAMLRALAGTSAEPLVRLPCADQTLVKRVLDAGAASVMFPFVESAEQARAAVAYTRYPPLGVRGVAAVHRASRYGRSPDYLRSANDQIAVVVQLETPASVERLPEIAAVPGVDSLFVGPGDLAAGLGHIGELMHEEVQRTIARAAELARAAGKPIGIVGPDPRALRLYAQYGYTWAAISSDLSLMTGRAGEWLATLRESAAPQPASSAY